jgi:flagellar export protein FliJ
MPFHYNLQNVLSLLEKKEKQIDAEVLEAARRRDIEMDRLNELEMRRTAAQKGLTSQMAEGTSDVAANNDYIQLLGQKAAQQNHALKTAEGALDDVKKRQADARRERSKLEKHKDMILQQWIIEEKKRDAKRIDSMAGTIYMKKRALAEDERLEDLDRMEKLHKLKLLQALREKNDRR